MARPDCDDGFIPIALELFPVLMGAGLPRECLIVLTEVLLHQFRPYGKSSSSVLLDVAQIEHYTDLHRNCVYRAIRSLVAWNVITKTTDGGYRFNKDYETWRIKGEAVDPGVIRSGLAAKGRFGSKKKHKTEAQALTHKRPPEAPALDSTSKTEAPALDSTSKTEAPALQDFVDAMGVRGKEERAPARASEKQGNVETGNRETGEPPRASLPAILIPDPEELRRTADLVDSLDPMASWGSKVRQFASMYPLPWILQAAQEAASRNKPWQYAHSILQRWQREGGPATATTRASPHANGHAPPPPTRTQVILEKLRRKMEESNAAGN